MSKCATESRQQAKHILHRDATRSQLWSRSPRVPTPPGERPHPEESRQDREPRGSLCLSTRGKYFSRIPGKISSCFQHPCILLQDLSSTCCCFPRFLLTSPGSKTRWLDAESLPGHVCVLVPVLCSALKD